MNARAFAATVAALALAAGGCGGGDAEEGERPSGPVVALYVIDHGGADPSGNALEPYAQAFGQIEAGCRISPHALADRIIQLSDAASKGSGVNITNLEALQAVARRVGSSRVDCTDTFATAEALLGGAAAVS
jgi:hypothetical protein